MSQVVLIKTENIDALELYVKNLNLKCIELQEFDKEIVSEEMAYEAYAIIKNIKIEDVGDVLLFCASMNLLNTYVKQSNSKIGYGFKNDIHYMTTILLNLDIDDVYINYIDKESLLVVQIYSIQFSFHYVKKKHEIICLCNSRHHRELIWDGVRKQKCAVSIFCIIKENQTRISNITYRGKPLQNKISKMMEVYREGKSTFIDLLY